MPQHPYRRGNPIESEKLAINEAIVEAIRPRSVLEAFAGDGTSTQIFSRYADSVFAIEKDNEQAVQFLKTIRDPKVLFTNGDNLRAMRLLSSNSFDLIDLDPYGSCYQQIEECVRLLRKPGVILASCADIHCVMRGFKLNRFPNSAAYKGRRAALWAEEVWIPYILELMGKRGCGADLCHFFASPVLLRAVFTIGAFASLHSKLLSRPRYVGWSQTTIEQLANLRSRRKRRSGATSKC
jgi:hypothetical protein